MGQKANKTNKKRLIRKLLRLSRQLVALPHREEPQEGEGDVLQTATR